MVGLWDGSTLNPVPDPGPGVTDLTGITVTATGDVFVAGWTGFTGDLEDRTAVAMYWNQSTWEVLPPSRTAVTQFNDVTVTPDGTVLFGGYAANGGAEAAQLEKWTGAPRPQSGLILLPAPDHVGSQYPGTGINAIDAASADAPPCAVGWLRRAPDLVDGATLRQGR